MSAFSELVQYPLGLIAAGLQILLTVWGFGDQAKKASKNQLSLVKFTLLPITLLFCVLHAIIEVPNLYIAAPVALQLVYSAIVLKRMLFDAPRASVPSRMQSVASA